MSKTASATNPQIIGGNPAALNDALYTFSSNVVADMAESNFTARAVATSIGTYSATGGVVSVTATGAMGTQDGVSMVAGDILLIPAGLSHVTAADAGPYTVTSVGVTASGAVFTRPSWWAHGAAIQPGAVIQVGGEGTLFAGSAWKSFVAKGKVIGTDAPLMFPDFVCQQATLSTGAVTVTNVPVLSTAKTQVVFKRSAVGGTVSTTVQYNPSTMTSGDLSTASVTVAAQIATGGTNTSDVSTGSLSIQNW